MAGKKGILALYPTLREAYQGQYVAIYQGQLVDDDTSYNALYERLHARYPNEVLWVSQIQETPLPDIVMRSPRLEPLQ